MSVCFVCIHCDGSTIIQVSECVSGLLPREDYIYASVHCMFFESITYISLQIEARFGP